MLLPLSERDKRLSQAPYFFKKFRERRAEIGYVHHQNFISEFYNAFPDPQKSLLIKDPRSNGRYGDTLCIFKNKLGIFVCVILRSGDYYEMVNLTRATKWQMELFDKKEELGKQGLEMKQ